VKTLDRRVPDATVARLTVYTRDLIRLRSTGRLTVSSSDLADMAGANSAQVRKDLWLVGAMGTRGVGYDIDTLIAQINRRLGLGQERRIAIVGVGNLGRALANYTGFASGGFQVVALFDRDPAKVDSLLGDLKIEPMTELANVVRTAGVAIGVLTVPADSAQDIADRLVASGVSCILNFAPAVLNVPVGVTVRKVDLSVELQLVSYQDQLPADLR
jgi:redox-sensing transcriptional repressor